MQIHVYDHAQQVGQAAATLLATGEDKAQAIHDAIHNDVTPQVPASILKYHPNVIFLLDKAAASRL